MQRAFESYVEALSKLPPASKDAHAALSEADETYNRLVNGDYAQSDAYKKLLSGSPPVLAVRELGKTIRAAR